MLVWRDCRVWTLAWAHGMALAPLGGQVSRALPTVVFMTLVFGVARQGRFSTGQGRLGQGRSGMPGKTRRGRQLVVLS